jgi:hypothetical protein
LGGKIMKWIEGKESTWSSGAEHWLVNTDGRILRIVLCPGKYESPWFRVVEPGYRGNDPYICFESIESAKVFAEKSVDNPPVEGE